MSRCCRTAVHNDIKTSDFGLQSGLPDCLRGLLPGPFLLSYSVSVFIFTLFVRFCAVR